VTIRLLFVGKPRDPHANAIAADYVKRASRFVRCEMREISARKADQIRPSSGATLVLLDPSGDALDSSRFTEMVRRAELDARDLVFLVGGADGMPPEWKERANRLLSLTPLTLPHELARVVLAEQIYRAVATLRGHPYPR
jgi:23S rRNA (pseudouridine1915-N3)-methyltransferase